MLGVEPDGDRAAAERSGDGVALGADGDGGVVVDLADGFLEDREAGVGESDEEVALGEPGLLGDEPGRAVDATVGDLGGPDLDAVVEILELEKTEPRTKSFSRKSKILSVVLIGLTPKTTMGSVRRWVGPTSPGP